MITIPTIAQLEASIIANLEAEFDATIDDEGKAMLRATAAVLAGQLKLLYLSIGATQKNIFPDSCDDETLTRFGYIKLNRQKFQPIPGQYTVSVTGTASTTIPAQTTFKSDDDSLNPGILYILDNDYTMPGSSGSITVRALTAGEDGKLEVGNTMTLTAPISGIDEQGTVTAEVIEPLTEETTDDYREAIVNAYRLEPQGGAASDYRLWASDAQGVEKVYPYAKSNAPCEINLFIEAQPDDSSDGKGTPTQAIIDAVEEVIERDPDTSLPTNERGRRPLQVLVNYIAVTIKTITITITGYQNIDDDIKAAILEQFTSLINSIRPFVAAADEVEERNDSLDTNQLITAIITAKPGSVFTGVTFKVDGVTYTSYNFVDGNIPWLNTTITYN